MKNLKLLAALLALTIGLAGCGGSSKGSSASSSKPEKMLDGDNMTASPSAKQEYTEPENVTYMRLLAGEDEYRACVLYLGGSYEVTTDVQKVLDSQTDLRDLWGFVYDIPQDHWVVAPDGGCDLYCIFPQEAQATLFVYETSLTDDAENPLQRGKQLYYSEDGQPILLLCNISDIVPNTEVELYPSTGEELVFSPFLSGENGHVVEAEGVCDFTIYPEGDDWETDTSPWSLEGNWLETGRDTDEGYFDTDPADADRMCFLPTDADTEGSQLPFTASYITPYPELNVEEADLFYQEGTPEVPFRSNQEWYATFTGPHGDRYAVTLEDEDTLALKFYLDGGESLWDLAKSCGSTVEAIRGANHLPQEGPAPARRVNLMIDIQERLAQGKGPAYARWAKIYNLKQMAAALQYLREHGLTDYEALAASTEAAVDRFHSLAGELRDTEEALSRTSQLMGAVVQYAKTRPVFDGYKAARYSKNIWPSTRRSWPTTGRQKRRSMSFWTGRSSRRWTR